ncbi:MAG: HK97 family phage prohead protease [Candidatus Neomarinimicrobiota bacterium]|jgi:hypothetical protein
MPEKEKRTIERRNFPIEELRTITEDDVKHITGYAAVFNALSEDLGYFREKIDPGAFTETIINDDIRALWNHNSDYVLGRNKSGTLTLSEDQRGLKIDITPPDAQWARDYVASIERGDINQMSFGFETLADRWEMIDGNEVRTLMKVRLFDVSPVTFPAYPDTEVALRRLEKHKEAEKSADSAPVGLNIRRKRLKIVERQIEEEMKHER